MKLEKLNRLFAAYNGATAASSNKPVEEKKIAEAANQVDEAVRVARDFGTQAAQASGGNEEKVARLREQVQNGTYNPDSREVAKSLMKELFA